MGKQKKIKIGHILWDLWCTFSVIGIWPRFIEPNLICQNHLELEIPYLPKSVDGFKIVQFSDLHFSKEKSDTFLEKLKKKIMQNKPDLIVFTGDFLCFSKLEDQNRLKKFLNSLHAPFGCYAIFGNHDYENFVSINSHGQYDVIKSRSSTLSRGFKRLFSKPLTLTGYSTDRAKNTGLHQELVDLLKETPFKLLHNENEIVKINENGLNICGLGEYSLGKCLPEKAYESNNPHFPTLVLSHNPDSLHLLKNYPSDLILSGHTHGGQVNLPGLRKKFLLLENDRLVRGLVVDQDKKIYINRGIGSVMKFRWFSVPEILILTLKTGTLL